MVSRCWSHFRTGGVGFGSYTSGKLVQTGAYRCDGQGGLSESGFGSSDRARNSSNDYAIDNTLHPEGTTGMSMHIAIPHGKSAAFKKTAVAFGIQRDGVDWNSMDGTYAKLIFLIAVPEEQAGNDHLKILQMLSRRLRDDNFREQLLQVKSTDPAYDLLQTIE